MSNGFSDNELDSILNNSVVEIKNFYDFFKTFACQIEETIKRLHNVMVNVENLKESEGVYDSGKRISNIDIYDLCRDGYKAGLVFYKIIREMEEENPLEVNSYNQIGLHIGFTNSRYPNVTTTGADKLLEKYGLKYPGYWFYGECNEVIYVSLETVLEEHLLLQSKIEEMFNTGIITEIEKDILLLTINFYADIVKSDYELVARKKKARKH